MRPRRSTSRRSTSRRFAGFVAPARARPGLWRLGAGAGVAIAGWLAAVALLLHGASDRRAEALLFLLSFGGLVLGLALALALLHRRRLGSLLGPGGLDLRAVATGAGACLAIVAASGAAACLLAPPERGIPLDAWARLLPIAVPLVALQCAAEELFFRGYLLQGLAARFRSPLVWWLLPGLFFGVLHWNPDSGAPQLTVASATLLGLLLADITARTGNLSAAIGIHIANNLAALLVLASPSSLDALALLVLVPGPAGVGPLARLDLATALAAWGAWLAVRRQSGASM